MTKTEIITETIKLYKGRLQKIKELNPIQIVLNKYDEVIEYSIMIEQYESLLKKIESDGEDIAIENRIKGITYNLLNSMHISKSTCLMQNHYHYSEMCIRTKFLRELTELQSKDK